MTIFKPAAVLLAGLLLAGTGFAQPAPDTSQDDPGYTDASGAAVDPPTRVARLSVIQGAVSFVPAGENDWVQAEINRPLISGDKLWTDRGGRAELQIGSSAVRVDEQSSFNFLNLDDNMAQIELTQGTINLRVRRIYDGQTYEVDTPTLAFVINRVGEYRIDVAPDGNGTIVTAFHGGGDAYGEAGARFRIEEGQSVRFNNPQLSDYVSNPVPGADDFDRFCFERDGRWDNSRSRQYVSEDIIGYDDLDTYGSWDNSAEYGNVWYPSQVDAGWTPYSYGRWTWVGAYGWTWVDSSPWGFAPFHYGRWAYIGNRWGWCPGPVHVRPYYAPALVAFVGAGGARLSFSVGGPVGWFPLGPSDVYVPSYRVSRGYFTNVNVYNTRINNVTINNFYGNYQRGNFDYSRVNYANRNVANAITAVRGDVFVNSREVRGSVIPVNRETFANARVAGFAAIAPTRQSLAFNGGARAAAPPQAVQARNIIAATRPPAPVASFAQRQNLLQRDPGRALPVNQLRATPTVIGNGQQAQRAALATRPNVNVVTQNGVPARTVAPTIQTRGGPAQADGRTIDNNARDNRRAVDNNNRALTPQANPQVLREQQQQNNPVQGRNVVVPPNGRPQVDNERRALPSSRYVNPNAADNSTQQRVIRGENNADTNRQVERLQRDNPQQYRSAPVERAPQVDVQQQQRAQQEMQQRRQQDAIQLQQRQQQQQQQQQRQENQQRDYKERQQQQFQQRQEMQMRGQQQQQQQIQERQEMQMRNQQQQQQIQQRQEMQMRAQQQQQQFQQREAPRAQPQQQPRNEQPQPRGRVQKDDNDKDRGHR